MGISIHGGKMSVPLSEPLQSTGIGVFRLGLRLGTDDPRLRTRKTGDGTPERVYETRKDRSDWCKK